MVLRLTCLVTLLAVVAPVGSAGDAPAAKADKALLWVLKPLARPALPAGFADALNPIDAFIAAGHKAKGLTAAGPADRRSLLRRVTLDLIGLPPTTAEQDAFVNDQSPDAYEKVVDRLLASDQHGVRYARHWLDVLRYADEDERMIAARGIHHWRDWVINALNADLPYDQFVRAQLTGYRSTVRTQMSATATAPDPSRGRTTCSRSASWPAGPSSVTARTSRNSPSRPSRRCRPRSWG